MSPQLQAATFAAVAAMGSFAIVATAPVQAHNHRHHGAATQPNIVAAAQGTGVHETLVAAVRAAGLVETLSGPGPFTVFAPTDTAFAKLPDGTVPSLLETRNRDRLRGVLTYHVVAGTVSARDLAGLIRQGGGTARIDTVAGETLTARLANGTIVITDGAGRATAVTQADVRVANGVIHVTDGVFLPG